MHLSDAFIQSDLHFSAISYIKASFPQRNLKLGALYKGTTEATGVQHRLGML